MRAHRAVTPAILLFGVSGLFGLTAGCGSGSPAAPSTVTPPTVVIPAAAQGIVAATLTDATGMIVSAALTGRSNVLTRACPGGGAMTMTFTFTPGITSPAGLSGTVTSSSRMEFNDCRSQTVTINGDPYLTMTSEHAFGPPANGSSSSMSTIRMTGGLRFDVGGTQGRAQYDCTQTMSLQIGSDGTPATHTVTSSGTITWEQPIGSVTVRPCSS